MIEPTRTRPATGPQSFFEVVSLCWMRPGLLLVELAWRWACGGFLLILCVLAAQRIASATGPAIQSTGLFHASLESAIEDPAQLSVALASTFAILRPFVTRAAVGLAPLALLAWAGAFALGRAAVLRRYDRSLPARPWLMAGGEALRLLAMVALWMAWYEALEWAARYALGPTTEVPGVQTEPNLVLYCALVICMTIGIFALWSLVSWSLVAAPLIALLEGASFSQGLRRSLQRGRVRGKLVEVNLAMSVIKLGLLVLATVLSATPLPFESIMQGWPLGAWWVFVTLLYLAASDFFKVARWLAFLEFWRLRSR